MKKILLLIISGFLVSCVPCENSSTRTQETPIKSKDGAILKLSGNRFHIVKIRSCDYIVTENSNDYRMNIVHAEDCANPDHLNQNTNGISDY